MFALNAYLLDPSPKLSRDGQKPWVIRADELGHLQMVPVDSNLNTPGKNRRILRHDLYQDVSIRE